MFALPFWCLAFEPFSYWEFSSSVLLVVRGCLSLCFLRPLFTRAPTRNPDLPSRHAHRDFGAHDAKEQGLCRATCSFQVQQGRWFWHGIQSSGQDLWCIAPTFLFQSSRSHENDYLIIKELLQELNVKPYGGQLEHIGQNSLRHSSNRCLALKSRHGGGSLVLLPENPSPEPVDMLILPAAG